MAERRLVITVGTSLFSSASWRADGRILKVTGYKDWLSEEYLDSPGLRRTRGWKIAKHLQELAERLAAKPEELARFFDWDPDRPLRYPAELTTLIRLFHREAEASETVQQFLLRRYRQIDLVCPASRRDPARLAADQLEIVIGQVLEHPACQVAEVLRSPHVSDLVSQLGDYLRSLPEGATDLLVTGGYKAFALIAALMAAHRKPGEWRLLYLHEDQLSELVGAQLDTDRRWRQTFDDSTRIVELPPTPVGE